MNNKHSKEDFLVPWTEYGIPWECKKESQTVSYFDYVDRKHRSACQVIWKPNEPFKAGLELKRFIGSTDSTQIIVQHTETNQLFYMRDADFLLALKKSACTYGVLLGEWKVKKTVGKYYGLELVV